MIWMLLLFATFSQQIKWEYGRNINDMIEIEIIVVCNLQPSPTIFCHWLDLFPSVRFQTQPNTFYPPRFSALKQMFKDFQVRVGFKNAILGKSSFEKCILWDKNHKMVAIFYISVKAVHYICRNFLVNTFL